jgi:hypothetical protein
MKSAVPVERLVDRCEGGYCSSHVFDITISVRNIMDYFMDNLVKKGKQITKIINMLLINLLCIEERGVGFIFEVYYRLKSSPPIFFVLIDSLWDFRNRLQFPNDVTWNITHSIS